MTQDVAEQAEIEEPVPFRRGVLWPEKMRTRAVTAGDRLGSLAGRAAEAARAAGRLGARVARAVWRDVAEVAGVATIAAGVWMHSGLGERGELAAMAIAGAYLVARANFKGRS